MNPDPAGYFTIAPQQVAEFKSDAATLPFCRGPAYKLRMSDVLGTAVVFAPSDHVAHAAGKPSPIVGAGPTSKLMLEPVCLKEKK